MKKKILAVVDDIGGAKALGPVLQELKLSAGVELIVLSGERAGVWLKELGLAFDPLPKGLTAPDVTKIFSEQGPALLVTGASWVTNSEQLFRNQAAKQALPSFTFFDFWMNYAKRFQHADYAITKAADTICVADSEMGKDVYTEGFPKGNIIAVGHPHLDFLSGNQEQFTASSRKLRKPGAAIFLSEDYSEHYLRSLGRHPIQIAAGAFSQWLEAENISSAPFHLRLHPREGTNAFLEEALREIECMPRLETKVLDPDSSLLHQMGAYEFAFGYQSMALFEASALGLKSLGIPMLKGERYPSLFSAMNKCGIKFVRLDPREIIGALSAVRVSSVSTPYAGAILKMRDLILNACQK